MLSSAKIGVSSWRYYQNSVRDGACEYYLGGEQPGVWAGRGLPHLGLTPGEQVTEPQLEAVFARALHPVTGRALGRAWRADAVTGFDLTFSAPKSVSTLWALGGVTAAAEVDVAHRAAVTAALTYLDEHAALSRRGTDGVHQIGTAGLVAALFDHRTSRAGDPQLHTHALVPNKLLSADGVWRTIDGHGIYHHKKAAGSIYQAALRAELHSRLGVEFDIPNTHGQAEILGVPTDLMTVWSKRTTQIRAEVAPVIAEYETTLGRELTGDERATITKTAVLKTRDPKQPAPAMATLHQQWRAEAGVLGWDADTLHQHVTTAAATAPASAARRVVNADPDLAATARLDLVAGAVRAAGRRRAVFSRADLTIEIAAHLPVSAATAEQVRVAIQQHVARAVGYGWAIKLGPTTTTTTGVTARVSDARYTSNEVMLAESHLIARAHTGQRGHHAQLPPDTITPETLAGLADDQAAAVRRLLTSGELITVLTAPAGAGKTTTIGAAAQAWQNAGYQIIALAPSARAAAELGTATGSHGDTLAKWLHQQQRLTELPADQRAAWITNEKTVLIVDEASMASTFDLDTLTRTTFKTRTKTVLVGDPAQIGVINGPGGILPALTARGHGIELTGIHRFSHPWEAQASLQLRAGNPAVIDTYQQHGRLHPVRDSADAAIAVFTHWQQAQADGSQAMMLAVTKDDVNQLNTLAKTAAQTAGTSHGPEITVGGKSFQAGDVIVTRRNQRSIPVGASHVRNGDRYTILTTTPAGALLVTDHTGRGNTLLPAKYVAEHVDHGWATTINTAQGTTTDHAVLLIRPGIDREHLYVGLTRGRHHNHAYITTTPDDGDDNHQHPGKPAAPDTDTVYKILAAALARSGQQDAAHTHLERAAKARPLPPVTATPPTTPRPAPPATPARPIPEEPARPPWGGGVTPTVHHGSYPPRTQPRGRAR